MSFSFLELPSYPLRSLSFFVVGVGGVKSGIPGWPGTPCVAENGPEVLVVMAGRAVPQLAYVVLGTEPREDSVSAVLLGPRQPVANQSHLTSGTLG